MNDSDIKKLTERISQEVQKEVQGFEKAFTLKDLSERVRDLGKIGKETNAWKVSYDTSGSVLQPGGPGSNLGTQAWKVSYDTSGSVLQSGLGDITKK